MLPKTLQQVFITKKFTQCKTSRTLKIDVFEIPDYKGIRKLFSKYEPLFLDQKHFRFDSSQIFPIASFIISVKFYSSQLKPFFNTIPIMFLIGFPILSYPIQPQPATSIAYTKPYGKRSQ